MLQEQISSHSGSFQSLDSPLKNQNSLQINDFGLKNNKDSFYMVAADKERASQSP